MNSIYELNKYCTKMNHKQLIIDNQLELICLQDMLEDVVNNLPIGVHLSAFTEKTRVDLLKRIDEVLE